MMEHGHTPEEIASRLGENPRQSYLRDWIYGGIDGAVTTFAVVAGVTGATLPIAVILILGFANLIADGFSMAASNYLGTKSEEDEYKRYEAYEQKQIKLVPEGEREEIRQIFAKKGLKGELLEQVVRTITDNKKIWINTMLREEYGLPAAIRAPWKAAFSTFAAFFTCGLIPLVPFTLNLHHSFFWAAIATGIVFFGIGSIKSHWSLHSWWYSGLITLAIGAITAGLAYGIGYTLHQIIP